MVFSLTYGCHINIICCAISNRYTINSTLSEIFIVVDGAWGQWGAWGTCSLSCGSGLQSRSRVCDDPRPQNGGLDCSGDSSEFGSCNTQACPTVAVGTYQQVFTDYTPLIIECQRHCC